MSSGAGVRVTQVAATVADLARASRFLVDAVGFSVGAVEKRQGAAWDTLFGLAGASHVAQTMRLGDESVTLLHFDKPGRPLPLDSRSNDLWFQHLAIVVSDMSAAEARLNLQRGRLVSAAPQTIPESNLAAAGIQACYFRNPDDHILEFICFPPDKGLARWHDNQDRLHLGIDHTALAVSDTQRSLRFYRDGLGLREVGQSHNHGPTQERLSGVPGADVRITGLRGDGGLGVEFLQYLQPSGGRPIPPDLAGNDLGHMMTVVLCADLAATLRTLQQAGAGDQRLSPVVFGAGEAPFQAACLVRDPDGHPLLLTQEV